MSTYLVIRKMQIHNANAMSSTYTIGVPAMTHGWELSML